MSTGDILTPRPMPNRGPRIRQKHADGFRLQRKNKYGYKNRMVRESLLPNRFTNKGKINGKR